MMPYLFSPDSVFWKVNREWIISLAGPRAVLLELAHPLIAEGVAHHSDFRRDGFGRLYRTMKTMTEITFGAGEDTRTALKHFHQCHKNVRGESQELVGRRYDANDPDLKFWVLATLIDSVLRVYELFITPVTDADKAAYYADAVRLAHVLGIPAASIPPTYPAFNLYADTMLYGGTLQVTQTAREVSDALFAPRLFGRVMHEFSVVSIGLLPPHMRDAFGFQWNDTSERRLLRFAAWSRQLRPRLPDRLCVHPKAYSEERRRIKLAPGLVVFPREITPISHSKASPRD